MPDSGQAWTAMETILDKKMPRTRVRDRRRWVLLILLLLLLIGVCNCPGRCRYFHNQWMTRKSVPVQAVAPPAPAIAPPVNAVAPPAAAAAIPAGTPTTPGAAGIHHVPGAANIPDAPDKPGSLNAHPDTAQKHPAHPHPAHPHAMHAHPAPRNRPGSVYSDADTAFVNHQRTGGSENPAPGSPEPPSGSPKPAPGSTKPAAGTPNPPPGANAPMTPPKRSAAKDSTHKKPAPKPQDQPPPEKQNGWMIGVGLNQFFPIGGQQGSTFNSNGLTGTLSDYLPVPMVRYYFNPRLYIQLEAQFNTPQATKKNLVISSPTPDTSYIRGSTLVSTASLRQLYYFNIPLSVHFQPWDNVNIGTGLQFSHLSNAIGDFDSTLTTTGTSTVENAKAVKSFKGDTLYQHLRTNEFRFLLDVNYTYRHFILGLRYNQALSDFVNVQLATGKATQSRNSSLQLYLRYILFDSRKKKGSSAPK